MPADLVVVILAGGQGTRFWPVSRQDKPKQFLSLNKSGGSLIQATAQRVKALCDGAAPAVVTNVAHRTLVKEHLPGAQIIAEPFARNTAAAIGLAALHAKRKNPDAAMILLPADHMVDNEDNLRATLLYAAEVAHKERALVTIGIHPESAHTGYGYIQRGERLGSGASGISAHRVKHFHEKPTLERAKAYAADADFYWNSGMFVWRPDVLLAGFEQHMPGLYAGLLKIEAALGTAREEQVISEVYNNLESISIDYGLIEHASNCAVVEALPLGWSDVGSWDAWAEQLEKDSAGNVRFGDVLIAGAKDCIAYSEGKLTALLGVQDLVVINSPDALLVCPRDQVQDVKKIVDALKASKRTELI